MNIGGRPRQCQSDHGEDVGGGARTRAEVVRARAEVARARAEVARARAHAATVRVRKRRR